MNAPPMSDIAKWIFSNRRKELDAYVKANGTYVGFVFEKDGMKYKIQDSTDAFEDASKTVEKLKKEFDIKLDTAIKTHKK